MLLQQGSTIKNKYLVESFLGEGAFAEVYRVKHNFLGRQALKIFKVPSVSLAEIEEALGEAVLLSKIGHPNIIRVYDASTILTEIGECAFFTMEYIPGGSLDSYWRSFGNKLIPLETTVEIITQLCKGLSVAHLENPPIIHRDIKPQNILIGFEQDSIRVRLGDFGLAKRVNPLTLLASAHGTIGFKPPEFLENIDSCAGDVWAVGSVMYLLLTDIMPFKATVSDTEQHVAVNWSEPLKPPSYYNINVDGVLDTIVLNALMFEHSKRYKNALRVIEELDKWTSHKPTYRDDVKELNNRNNFKRINHIEPKDDKKETIDIELNKILELSQQPGNLEEAALKLNQLLIEHPEFNERYGYLLSLWNRGITM